MRRRIPAPLLLALAAFALVRRIASRGGADGYERGVRAVWRTLTGLAEGTVMRTDTIGDTAPELGSGRAPVLLFGGYANDSRSVGAFARSLRRDGFDAYTMTLPGHGMGDVREQRLAVRERVAEIRGATGAPRVDLVGYSHGGYVARAAAQLDGGDATIGRVVTLSTANTGFRFGVLDRLAARVLPLAVRQVCSGSALLRELDATGADADVVVVGARGWDGIIPGGSGALEGKQFLAIDEGRRIGRVSRVNHLRVLTDARAYALVRGALAAQPVT